MLREGILLYVHAKPYAFTPVGENVRKEGTNYFHYILTDDGEIHVAKTNEKFDGVSVPTELLKQLPEVRIKYKTFKTRNEKNQEIEVLQPDSIIRL